MFNIYKWKIVILVIAGILTIENKFLQSMELPKPFHIPVPLTTKIDGKLDVFLTIIKNNTTPLILERYDDKEEKSEIIPKGEVAINKNIGFTRYETKYSATYALKRETDDASPYLLNIFYTIYDSTLHVSLSKPGISLNQQASIVVPFMAEWIKRGRANIILTINPALAFSAISINVQETL